MGRDDQTVDSQPEQCSVNLYLVRWGFCNIPAEVTMPFAAELHDEKPVMYASLYAHSKLWIVDYEVNHARYGCLSVERPKPKTKELARASGLSRRKQELYLTKGNPNPVWIPQQTGHCLVNHGQTIVDIIKAGTDTVQGELYFGRSTFGSPKPCKVTTEKKRDGQVLVKCWETVNGEEAISGEVLKDTGHELVRTKNGDPVPPNAVIAGVSDTDGTLYLGRVGGSIPCAVSAESDKIKCFRFYTDGIKQVESGEIVVLTK